MIIGNYDELKKYPRIIEEANKRALFLNPHGRPYSSVKQHSLNGLIGELCICRSQNYLLNRTEDFHYDIFKKDLEIKSEVKTTFNSGDELSEYWNVKFVNYKFFLENRKKLKYIYKVEIFKGDVHLRWRADAKTFKKFLVPSKYGYADMYNYKSAIRNNLCKEF